MIGDRAACSRTLGSSYTLRERLGAVGGCFAVFSIRPGNLGGILRNGAVRLCNVRRGTCCSKCCTPLELGCGPHAGITAPSCCQKRRSAEQPMLLFRSLISAASDSGLRLLVRVVAGSVTVLARDELRMFRICNTSWPLLGTIRQVSLRLL